MEMTVYRVDDCIVDGSLNRASLPSPKVNTIRKRL